MQIGSVLVVCVGNICRSPLGERLLARDLPGLRVTSAGLGAVVGAPADADASRGAAEIGVSLDGHVARQITAEIGKQHDLILVMEPGHRTELARRFPELSGRVMLFDQWLGGTGIEDPFRRPMELHRTVRDRILAASRGWVQRLNKK
jgi:protein-tyrosine phosphatase